MPRWANRERNYKDISRKISRKAQEYLFQHLSGPVPAEYERRNEARALLARGLIQFDGHPVNKRHQRTTLVTNDGRQVAAYALADCAEQLIAAGYLERDRLPFLPTGQLAPAIVEDSVCSAQGSA